MIMGHMLARLKGRVMGFSGDSFTRPLTNVNVFLRVHVRDDQDNEFIFSPLDLEHIQHLQKYYPDLFEAIMTYRKSFSGRTVEDPDGTFEFAEVPIGWWCYVIVADADGEETDIMHKLANNGFGRPGEIRGKDLESRPELDGIIVPVHDKWYEENRAEPKADDPPMDPQKDFVPGIRFD
ncbi:hypothetical protein KY363_01905 [Candidatus Woesearchaeota archaeon]|nr:hypothetical protein [Candidatus Woesearchaeota archaeon]